MENGDRKIGSSSPSINDDMTDFEQFCATKNYQKDCWLLFGLRQREHRNMFLVILYLVFTVLLYLMLFVPNIMLA
jgi:hypothetical protein